MKAYKPNNNFGQAMKQRLALSKLSCTVTLPVFGQLNMNSAKCRAVCPVTYVGQLFYVGQ